MGEGKLWTLVRRLNSETLRGVLNWERTSEEGAYQVAFPKGFTVVIAQEEGPPPTQFIRILDPNGELVEVASDEELDRDGQGGHVAFRLMTETYKAARRKAMGIDAALDAILSDLNEAPEEDIPF